MSNDNQSSRSARSRRDFIKQSGALLAGAAAFHVLPGRAARAADGDETLRIGLVGCGGRGTGAARQALIADPNSKIVALGDAFVDRVEESLKSLAVGPFVDRVQVDEDHKFTGFDNYRGVIAASDVVVLAAPPVFRPQHLAAAVEAGCHVFCEKPVAVDGPGVRSILETCRKAKEKNLSVVSGLCYRYSFGKRDTIERIHGGALGQILTMQTTYNTGGLWFHERQPEWSDVEYQVRNWLYHTWLSGDHINEQHIHSLDKVAWAMDDVYPVRCTSSGGRIVRTDPKFGNVYDHFNTVYEWENGVKAFSSCRQWENTSTDVSDYVVGTEATASLQDHTIKPHRGEGWKWDQRPDDMYQNEIDELFAAIRADEPINDGEWMTHSTLMAIMGRMSAYTGRTITWKQALESKENLLPDPLEWGDLAVGPVARPGITKFL